MSDIDKATLNTLLERAKDERMKVQYALLVAPAATCEEESLEVSLQGWDQTLTWLEAQRESR